VSGIQLKSVGKVYPNGVRAIESIELDVQQGEFVVLVGPSGCGKSTLLRMIAGLEEVTEGSIFIGDRDVTELQPRERDIAMVFQNYALYPHMTVRQNLGFGLKLRRTPKAEIRERVHAVGDILGLLETLNRRPATLSGGQRQRVAIGRAMVRDPSAFLMDEPLSNLDAKLRVSVRAQLAALHKRLGVTTVYVTHDQVEAMTLGDRVAVLSDGVLQQFDTPLNLFRSPANLFVAAFIGSPSMNLVEANVSNGKANFGGFSLPLPEGSPLRGVTRDVILGLRPTDFEIARSDTPADHPRMTVTPSLVEQLGTESYLIFPVNARQGRADLVRAASGTEDEEAGTLLVTDDQVLFTARVDGRSELEAGVPIELVVHSAALLFFNPADGLALV
jgi:multiple sugar transport system ATP-binding protein